MEERKIIAKHIKSNTSKEFKNRTELYAYLEEQTKLTNKVWDKSEFEIEDVQIAKSSAEAFRCLGLMLDNILYRAGYNPLGDSYIIYVGSGETFRHREATIIEYKGNRKDTIKPLLLKECRNYILKNWDSELITNIEADDAVNIATVQGYYKWKVSQNPDDKVISVTIDKDALAGPGFLFNPDKDESPRLIEGLGELYLTNKNKVTGHGRIFKYFQILYGDPVDNYYSNSATSKSYGEKSAYRALKDCKDDESCLRVLVEEYKKLYPKKVKIEGWRGDIIEIDWLYVLKENANLATMLTTKYQENREDDDRNIEVILKQYGIL